MNKLIKELLQTTAYLILVSLIGIVLLSVVELIKYLTSGIFVLILLIIILFGLTFSLFHRKSDTKKEDSNESC